MGVCARCGAAGALSRPRSMLVPGPDCGSVSPAPEAVAVQRVRARRARAGSQGEAKQAGDFVQWSAGKGWLERPQCWPL